MFHTFQTRLVLFFGLLFLIVGLATLLLVRNAIQNNIFDQARAQLVTTNDIFNIQVKTTAETLEDGSAVVAQDFGFRQAVATDDRPTILSALDNLAARISADRAFLVSLDNVVLADTTMNADTVSTSANAFAFPDMIETADIEGSATSVAVLDEKIYQLVVVPVLAPVPIAWIVVGVEIDDAFAMSLQQASTVPADVTFAYENNDGKWLTPASTLSPELRTILAGALVDDTRFMDEPETLPMGGSDYVTLVEPLSQSGEGSDVDIALQYSLDVALQPYQPLFLLLLILAAAALTLTLIAAVAIANSIAKPIRQLDTAARRIQDGHYNEKITISQKDELGRLSETFNQMMDGIAEREERIAYQARHDSPSGLPNRMSFEGHVADMIVARQEENSVFSVLLLQIDRFSEINSTLGHETGEHLVRKIGKSLQEIVPGSNTVARHSNSILAVALDELDSTKVKATVDRILHFFEDAISIGGLNVDVTITIGAARYPEHGATSRVLLQHADTAIYEAKRASTTYMVYDPELDPYKPERLSMMGELRRGLDEGQFKFYYQPKVDIATGTVTAVEALIRWIHPERGFMPPDLFIPMAEQTGNIKKLTNWALDTVVKQSRAWSDKGIHVKIGVNLSAHDLTNRHLPAQIGKLLADHDVRAESLILEITESAVMEDPTRAMEVLKELNAMDLTLSIDDYGTGYSSMAYLKSLPVQEIKIDKSFVLNLAENAGDEILVRSTIELGHNLGLKVTAEGIEDQGSLDILKRYGCETGQGYFISKPIPVQDFEEFYATSRWSPNRSSHEPASTAVR